MFSDGFSLLAVDLPDSLILILLNLTKFEKLVQTSDVFLDHALQLRWVVHVGCQ